jgi:glucose-6-phosphate isomerase
MSIKIETEGSKLKSTLFEDIETEIITAHKKLYDFSGKGNDFLGWVRWPEEYDEIEFERIKVAAEKIRNNCDVFLIIGIGGSYLGAKAAIDALKGSFYNELDKDNPQIYFLGNNISGRYISEILSIIEDKEICVNVISKSGTTTEPAVAFRIIKKYMEEKYGKKESSQRIFVTTDKNRGALKDLATKEDYETFSINDDIGGRYSVMTPVGLLPMAVAGIDILSFMKGAQSGMKEYSVQNIKENEAYKYVAYRNILYKKGKKIEILANYEPSLSFLSEWWKQLYGESEGKEGKGIFPASVNFTADLHSMGQYIQEGERSIFETVLRIENPKYDMQLPYDDKNFDDLNYLEGKTLSFINEMALKGTFHAHVEGDVPNCIITVEKMNSFNLGKLLYFFMISCGISGYLIDVNPFNQPGVEAYKKNMFALLGKAGFDDLRKKLLNC